MTRGLCAIFVLLLFTSTLVQAQEKKNVIEISESMEDYINENHIDEIEDIVHKFANSPIFLQFLLEQGHNIDPNNVVIKKKDIRVGDDVDVYVKHFTDHQNFTMILVPVDIYSQLIYDTLLFSVLEVSDQWLKDKYQYHDIENSEVKEKLMSLENHDQLANHMYHQGRDAKEIGMSEVQIELREGYISSSSIHKHMSDMSKDEKKDFRKSWGLMKKAFAHDIDLNVEMNIYIFGVDDMRLLYNSKGDELEYKITPRNIFTRHVFLEE
ncbi:MAG: hypothetical protein JXR03_08305 [Cyclobacteriaceae bacterium]